MKQNRQRKIILMLTIILFLFVFFSLKIGTFSLSVKETIQGIFGLSEDEKINIIIQKNRLPRILTALIAGAGLGLSGCVFQAVLQNPLASASTLGVAQGANFGAAIAIIGFGMSTFGGFLVPVFAFAGSMLVAILILVLSRFREMTTQGIVLAGVAISAMLTGGTTILQYFADDIELANLIRFTFGDLGYTDTKEILLMFIVVTLFFVYTIAHRFDYNALAAGKEMALSVGIQEKNMVITNMILCCLTASVIISHVGMIGFVGLIAPHLLRLIIGSNYRYLIPGSIVSGAMILLLSDLLSKTIISPIILPIGAITSFLGGPIFLYLVFRKKQ